MPSGINWVYIVRLGSFQNPAQAQELQKRLQQKGYAVAVKSGQSLQKGKVYHLDLKALRDAAAAKAQLDKLQKEEKVNPVLLKVAETR
jgi:cell division septation protein DedD